jgi:hypothetical protein
MSALEPALTMAVDVLQHDSPLPGPQATEAVDHQNERKDDQ